MRHDPAKHLFDALQACESIAEFTKGKTFDDYKEDLILRSAVERQLEILGEAFNRLDTIAPEYLEQCPEMGQIIGMRNRIIHGYDTVDAAIVWDAITNHVPRLLTWLQEVSR